VGHAVRHRDYRRDIEPTGIRDQLPRPDGWARDYGRGFWAQQWLGLQRMFNVGGWTMSEPAPRFGLVIVGDEILSGKREDKHFATVIRLLAQRGLALAWARYAGDDRAALTALYRDTFASGDVVFSCGGIGSTPDDHTRQSAAAALGVPVVLHPEAELLIAQRCADMAREGRGTADMNHPENRQRLKMGEFPAGASIIPNPFNRIPGFSIRNHWFVPGFSGDGLADDRVGARHVLLAVVQPADRR